MTSAEALSIGRLRWRCRRGMKELDILLLRYLDEEYRCASIAARTAFERLLESDDGSIEAYCLGGAPAPTQLLASLIARITANAPKLNAPKLP